MRDLSLHVLDIAENSINAGASRVWISIKEDSALDRFILSVSDDGKGMDIGRKAADPYFTAKSGKRFGLGIPLLMQAAEDSGGCFRMEARPGGGTTICAEFQRSHPDMKPLGDMGSTVMALAGGHPELDCIFAYELDSASYLFDSRDLRENIEGLPLNHPAVLEYIKENVNEGIRRING